MLIPSIIEKFYNTKKSIPKRFGNREHFLYSLINSSVLDAYMENHRKALEHKKSIARRFLQSQKSFMFSNTREVFKKQDSSL